jgi:hypothetical protein
VILRNRKGYFFLIDAFIGSAIIFVSLAVILSSDVKVTPLHYDYSTAEGYASFIIDTKIEDLNNAYVNGLVSSGVITNTKNTIMDQITQFYYNAYYVCPPSNMTCQTANLTYASTMVQNISILLLTEKYGFEYIIRDYKLGQNYTVYVKNPDTRNTSQFVVVSKKITFLQTNTSEMFGPEIVDIIVWI